MRDDGDAAIILQKLVYEIRYASEAQKIIIAEKAAKQPARQPQKVAA